MADDKHRDELASFQDAWEGGYHEGDPLDPMGDSTYAQLAYMSVLHVAYLVCIRPWLRPDTIALEIGPGRGAWTRALLPAREVHVLDARSAADNGFWEHVGEASHVHYHQVEDFSCRALPDDHFDYMFSFGCLCHVSFDGVTAYAENLLPKLRAGARCFWMVADYHKYNAAIADLDRLSIYERVITGRGFRLPGGIHKLLRRPSKRELPVPPDVDQVPRPRRWYDAGVEPTVAMLERTGYEVLTPDLGINHRDPVIEFRKPER